MVAADSDDLVDLFAEFGGGFFDLAHGFVKAEGVGNDVTGVDDLLAGEGRDVLRGVVGAQQARGFAHVAGAEAGTGAEAHAGVEGHTHDGDVGGRHVLDAGQLGEGRDPCVARGEAGIDRALRRVFGHGATSFRSCLIVNM